MLKLDTTNSDGKLSLQDWSDPIPIHPIWHMLEKDNNMEVMAVKTPLKSPLWCGERNQSGHKNEDRNNVELLIKSWLEFS
jgi:hypothetical protein